MIHYATNGTDHTVTLDLAGGVDPHEQTVSLSTQAQLVWMAEHSICKTVINEMVPWERQRGVLPQ